MNARLPVALAALVSLPAAGEVAAQNTSFLLINGTAYPIATLDVSESLDARERVLHLERLPALSRGSDASRLFLSVSSLSGGTSMYAMRRS